MKIILIILAAGQGRRFGLSYNKLFFKLSKKPLIQYFLKKVEQFKKIDKMLLVTDKKHLAELKKIVLKNKFKKVINIMCGGKERQDSVYNALKWLNKNMNASRLFIGIHDGARLNISEKLINRLIAGLQKNPAVIPALKITDTIKSVKNNFILKTIPRHNLYKVATPQFFKFDILYQSYIKALKEKFYATDDAGILEFNNHKVKIIEGELENIKLTYMNDLKYIMKDNYKTGLGFDIHRLKEGKKLIIGGITIKYKYGLEGHSDADVLIHAVIDSLLGACGLNDIGVHFPDTDKKYKNIKSTKLLKETMILIKKENYEIINMDTIIFAQQPKIHPYSNKIRFLLSKLLCIDKKNINVKAKTMEGLGFIGQQKAIAAQSIVLLKKTEL